MSKVLIGVPSYNGSYDTNVRNKISEEVVSGNGTRAMLDKRCSILDFGFNTLYAIALNNRDKFDYFMLWHSDILVKTPNVIDRMVEDMEKYGLDVLSAVVPIKDEKGLCSCGLQFEFNDSVRRRRLTMNEIPSLNPLNRVVSADDLQSLWDLDNGFLLMNTGLLLIRLGHEDSVRLFFSTESRIVLTEEGLYKAVVTPEDWNFSKLCAHLGMNCALTPWVNLSHLGMAEFGTHQPWGVWDHDQNWEDEKFNTVESNTT